MILPGKVVQRYMDAEDMWLKKKRVCVSSMEYLTCKMRTFWFRPTKFRGLGLEFIMTMKSPYEDRSKRMCVFFYILHTENQKHDFNPQNEDIFGQCVCVLRGLGDV